MNIKPKPWERRSHIYWHALFFVGVVATILIVLWGLGPVLTPVLAALTLSYLLDPVVTLMHRRWRLARWAGASVLFLVALIATGLFLLLVVPVLVHELQALLQADYLSRARAVIFPWVQSTFGVVIPNTLTELFDRVGTDAGQLAGQVLVPLRGVAGQLVRTTAGAIAAFGTIALIPVFTFYFLPKFPELVSGARNLIPPRYRPVTIEIASEIDRVLSAWIRGQVTVMICLAIAYSVGLALVGLRFAVLIGLLTGLLAFIPYVGFLLGAISAVTVALLEYQGPGQLIGVTLVFAAVQTAEGFFLTPRLVGDRVGLGPIGVLLALLFGGQLFGFVGVLLAVPVASALTVVIKRAITWYRASEYFNKPA